MMSDSTGATSTESGRTLAGKYLTFELGDEMYAFGILRVQEIIAKMEMTKVPKMPEFICGITNLRDKVIPVVDLRKKFEMEEREDTERTCIVVLQIGLKDHEVTMGVLVDGVSDVLDIRAEQIEDTPTFGVSLDTDFILGIGKVEDRVIMLLDEHHLLSGEEFEKVSSTTPEGAE